jgi:hypothetical protein
MLQLIINLKKLKKLNIPRYSWTIEMAFLDLNCEIERFINLYEKNKKK